MWYGICKFLAMQVMQNETAICVDVNTLKLSGDYVYHLL